jgi:hypothetical protein
VAERPWGFKSLLPHYNLTETLKMLRFTAFLAAFLKVSNGQIWTPLDLKYATVVQRHPLYLLKFSARLR